MIDIDVPYRPVVAALRELLQGLQERRELMGELAGIMVRSTERNFAEGGRPGRWADLHPGTKEARRKKGTWPGQILVRSATGLAASIQADWDNDQAVAGTNKAYAAIHQFGGTTRPHVIKPRYKRALAFGGVIVRQVNHPGSRIPARPFLALTDGDTQDMLSAAEDFVGEQIRSATPSSSSSGR